MSSATRAAMTMVLHKLKTKGGGETPKTIVSLLHLSTRLVGPKTPHPGQIGLILVLVLLQTSCCSLPTLPAASGCFRNRPLPSLLI